MRKRATHYSRPVPFGVPGEIIGALLDHIEAVDRWDSERQRDLGSIRESLSLSVTAHCKALSQLYS